jgi:hypothetical protein
MVPLEGHVELVAALEILVAVDRAGGGRRDHGGGGGLRNCGDRAVVQRRSVNHGRSAATWNVVGRAVVEHAAGSTDHHLAIAFRVPRETEARGEGEELEGVEITFAGETVDVHAIHRISRTGNDRADQGCKCGLASQRIQRNRLAVQRSLLVEYRGFLRIPKLCVEVRVGSGAVRHRTFVNEPQTVIDAEALGNAPAILDVPIQL